LTKVNDERDEENVNFQTRTEATPRRARTADEMLGSSSSTPGSLKPWYYVVHALQRLPTRQVTIADASRFCYGTATVECAGVGEAREDADEIVEYHQIRGWFRGTSSLSFLGPQSVSTGRAKAV